MYRQAKLQDRTSSQLQSYLPQAQQPVGSERPVWKKAQTDSASGVSSSCNFRLSSTGGYGLGSGDNAVAVNTLVAAAITLAA